VCTGAFGRLLVCVEERLIVVVQWPGVRPGNPAVRTHAFFESLALLASPSLKTVPASPACFIVLLYKQWPCQRLRRHDRCDMLYLGRGSSVTQCPLCDLFTCAVVAIATRREGPARVGRAGGVKIIDTFALEAAPAIQSRRAQMIECTVEFRFDRGVNELDMGEAGSASPARATARK
jgi:hypothetical protein